jgi:hypothetical protein
VIAMKPDSLVSKTGPSSFVRLKTEEDVEDYRARDGSSTSLVSSKPHAQLEEEDLTDECTEDKGGSSRDGERRELQHHLASDPDEVGVEGEGEGRRPYTHDL